MNVQTHQNVTDAPHVDRRSTTRLAIRACIQRRARSGESLSYAEIRGEVGGSNATIQQELEKVRAENSGISIGKEAASPAERERSLQLALEQERAKVELLKAQVEGFSKIKDDLNYLIERNSAYFNKLAVEIDGLRSAYKAVNEALKRVQFASKADVDEVLKYKNIQLTKEKLDLESENLLLKQRIRQISVQHESVFVGDLAEAEKVRLPLIQRFDDESDSG